MGMIRGMLPAAVDMSRLTEAFHDADRTLGTVHAALAQAQLEWDRASREKREASHAIDMYKAQFKPT
jgi:hypothetical protein